VHVERAVMILTAVLRIGTVSAHESGSAGRG
jgi:hypothetical protein